MRTFFKILGVLAGLAILVGVGYFIYDYFIASEEAAAPAPTAQTPIETPITADGVIKSVNNNPVLGMWVSSKTGAGYFIKENGELRGQFISNFNRFIPSPDGSRVVAVMDYPQNPVFAIYNTLDNTWERLPEGVMAADFDPSSSKIAYLNNRGLYVLDLTAKKTLEIMRLNLLDGELKWSGTNDIFIISDDVWYINLAQKTILNASGSEAGASYLFAEDSYNALKLVRRGANGYALVLIHQIGGVLNELPFTTIPAKCVFVKDALYCAVPRSTTPRTDILDDYLKEKYYTEDVLVSYDAEAGGNNFKVIYEGEARIDADQLTVKGNQLLFRNRYDGKIYSINIK